MYAIHTTPGLIVSSRPSGEAGKFLNIFTRDLGLIRATAQGIRFEKSKLRPFIQDYSVGVFSFVRGKEFWRLTNAQEYYDQHGDVLAGSVEVPLMGKNGEELIARTALLLDRLLQGEEAHPELFGTIHALCVFLHHTPTIDPETIKTLESLTVIRILHRLGYVALISGLKEYIDSDRLDVGLLLSLKDQRISMNQHINKALRESHL